MKHTGMDFYVASKIEHLRRLGLVGAKSTGLGLNGGACTDELLAAQLPGPVYARVRQLARYEEQN